MVARCGFQNYGYCKNKEKCVLMHVPTKCPNIATCAVRGCVNRHPKTCRDGESCRFGEKCAYNHDIGVSSERASWAEAQPNPPGNTEIEANKNKVEMLLKMIVEKNIEIETLENTIEQMRVEANQKEISADDLNEVIEVKDKVIKALKVICDKD